MRSSQLLVPAAATLLGAGLIGTAGLGGAPRAPADQARAAAAHGQGDECRSAVGRYDEVTRGDEAFNQTFRHGFAQVEDVRMHYVTGGRGPVLVLLHGWPQSWYEFREIMPALAENFTVVAADLPGLGDSHGAPTSYAKAVLARYVHGLIAGELGHHSGVHLAAHDLGAGVAFQYAAQHPGEIARVTAMDFPLPGPAVDAATLGELSWHFAFHNVPVLPEQVVDGDQRTYLAWFYDNFAAAPDRIAPEAVAEFVRVYCRDQVLSGGFELYRTLEQDTADNLAAAPLPMPVQVLSAGAGENTLPDGVGPFWQPRVAQPVVNLKVPDSGHWVAEENPDYVVERLRAFHRPS